MSTEKRPHFLIIGAPKAGTTSLCNALSRLPDVYMFPIKEAQFFDRKYDRGSDWYFSLFSSAPDGNIVGEGSPGYTIGPKASLCAERISALLPDVKLVYITRNPWDRIVSHYVQEISNGLSGYDFDTAVRNRNSIIESSKYNTIINAYEEFFPQDSLLTIFYEDLISNSIHEINNVLRFIGSKSHCVEGSLPRSNARESKSTDRAIFRLIRKIPKYDHVRNKLPRKQINIVRSILTKKIDQDRLYPAWNSDLLDYVDE